ncbi:hypothetical protein K7I13_02955 [Brucepastera parasyntrophica]|uniref:hypothetical protein n=1 Tax=Brucepastera parasyntrophica TaxID=2880008 RepID=UPI00210F00CC|nr:hypothetical protein [Brucepastera parasyntrophica]ULQ60287.1 hypothetical protein K7I13_02955 [Brucepastera parasyntrophica]
MNNVDDIVPKKAWFTLQEACDLKGLNINTSYNKKHLQPNGGVNEGCIGGRKSFRRDTIIQWLDLTDTDIEKNK